MKVKELITALVNEDMEAEVHIALENEQKLSIDGISRRSDQWEVILQTETENDLALSQKYREEHKLFDPGYESTGSSSAIAKAKGEA